MNKKKINETFDVWKSDPSPVNSGEFLKSIDSVIDKSLHSYAPGMEKKMKTKAQLMALNIAGKYNPDKGMQLTTYLMQNLHSLSRVYKKRLNPIKIPEQVVLERNRLMALENDFVSNKGREPSIQELADRSGMSFKRIERVKGTSTGTSESSLISQEGDQLFKQKKDPQEVWTHYVYHDLDPIDQKIFEWSTGWGGAKKIKKNEIAKRLKISAPAVSLRIGKITKKLEEGMNLG